MSIPQILPPQGLPPQGFTPNSLRPTNAAIQAAAAGMSAAQAAALVFNGTGIAKSTQFVLTNAQVLTLSSVPVTFQVAAGAGTILIPWYLYLHLDAHLGAWGTSRTISIRFQAGGPAVDLINPILAIPNTAIERIGIAPIQTSVNFSSTLNNPLTAAQSPVNWGLQISAAGDNTLGNAANFIRGVVWFMQIPTSDL